VIYGADTRGGEVLCYVCQYSAGGDYGCVEGAGGADGGDAGEGYRGDGGVGNGNLTALARAIGAVGYDNEMIGGRWFVMRRVGRIRILMLGIVRVARGVGWRRVWFYRFMGAG